ncbi:MAG: hypothetical protein IPM52_07020 [Bacteroidetes bacterium]|nr:hypothetical protein [Bacteroidota bacterium]
MKKLVLNILIYTLWTLTAAGIPLLFGFARHVHYQQPLREIEVRPLNKHQADFVPAAEVKREIKKLGNASLSLISFNNRQIEQYLLGNPYIRQAKAYTTLDRILVVSYSERVPMMRALDLSGEWHYIDTAGVIFPEHPERLFRLLPAIGHIPAPVEPDGSQIAYATDTTRNRVYFTLFNLGKIITADEFLNLLIDQVYIDEHEQVELIPALGTAAVFLGKGGNPADKLANVAAFYKAKSTSREFGRYALINASFENQIVCTIKRDSI